MELTKHGTEDGETTEDRARDGVPKDCHWEGAYHGERMPRSGKTDDVSSRRRQNRLMARWMAKGG